MHTLDIVSNVLVLIEKLHDFMAKNDLLYVRSWLLKPFLEETGTDLSSCLIE